MKGRPPPPLNSNLSGTTRKPPQNGGHGFVSVEMLSHFGHARASSFSRFSNTVLCFDAHVDLAFDRRGEIGF